jgi:ketosteroid isomerase-like protein
MMNDAQTQATAVVGSSDHEYPIALAKTEFRDAWNVCDAARLRNLLHPGLVEMSEAHPTRFGEQAQAALVGRMQDMWAQHRVDLVVIIIAIRISGDYAWDFGWHKWTLTPNSGGAQQIIRTRYLETWRRDPEGWKLANYAESRELA